MSNSNVNNDKTSDKSPTTATSPANSSPRTPTNVLSSDAAAKPSYPMQFARSPGIRDDVPLEQAVRLDGIYKKFGKRCGRKAYVLNGVTMHKCYTNHIYVLYGSIKSGKSTVLRIILQMCNPDNGSVFVFGDDGFGEISNNRHIGYMPQKYGFDDSLTVQELAHFYATLNGMSKMDTIDKFIRLKDSMAMTDLSVCVGTLQEHQKRILNFFIACMPDPDLLLLDEPTSGCDPVYKHFIYRQIRQMVDREKCTVLLTASDESECQCGDVMGYLRNGKLIAEDAPGVLLKTYNVPSISQLLYCVSIAEHISPDVAELDLLGPEWLQSDSSRASVRSGGFTMTVDGGRDFIASRAKRLSQQQQTEIASALRNSITGASGLTRNQQRALVNPWWRRCVPLRWQQRWSSGRTAKVAHQKSCRKRFQTLCQWRMLAIYRNFFRFLLETGLPLLCVFVYYNAVNGSAANMDVAIVGEMANAVRACRLELDALALHEGAQMMAPHDGSNSEEATVACKLAKFERDGLFNIHYFENESEARAYANSNKMDGILGTRDSGYEFMDLQLDGTSNLMSNKLSILISSAVGSRLAMSNRLAHHLAHPVGQEIRNGTLRKRNMASIALIPSANIPILHEFPIHERHSPNKANTDGTHLLWGCLVTIIHFCGMLGGALPLTDERQAGVTERLLRLGVGVVEQQTVHFLVRFAVALLQYVVLELFVVLMVFRGDLPAINYGMMFVLLVNQRVCGFAFGVLMFAVFLRSVPVLMCSVILQVMAATVSGFLWHESTLTAVYKWISTAIPHRHVALALNAIVSKDALVSSNEVWPGLLVPFVWTCASYAIYFALAHDQMFAF